MTQLEQKKFNAIDNLKNLCARCSGNENHNCPVAELIDQIDKLSGVPVIVNEQLKHVVFN